MKQSHFNIQQIDPPDRCTANIHPTPVSVSSWQTFHHCKPLALAGRTFALLLNHRRYRVLPLHVVNPISFRSILWRNNVGWQQQKKSGSQNDFLFHVLLPVFVDSEAAPERGHSSFEKSPPSGRVPWEKNHNELFCASSHLVS